MLVGIAACIAVMLATPLAIVVLFGYAFVPSTRAAFVLVPAATLLGFNVVLHDGLRGLDWPYVPVYAEAVGLVVTAASLLVMLRPYGIMGAAVASLLGYATITIALLFSTTRITAMSLSSFVLPQRREINVACKYLISLIGGKYQEQRAD